jgi:hypothetical protein
MTRKIEIERFGLTTSKAFNKVTAGVNVAIGHPDMAEFGRSIHEARSFDVLRSAVDVSSANSDPPNSGNSEPSRDSRKR